MDAPELAAIINFRRLAPDLITGGQPTEAQLAAVAAAGAEVVMISRCTAPPTRS